MIPKFKVYDKVSNKIYPVTGIEFSGSGFKRVHIIGRAPTVRDRGKYAINNTDRLNEERCILLQYSGVKDKKDIEIYDGDILKIESSHDDDGLYPTTYEDTVVFIEGAFVPICGIPGEVCEVIGNINMQDESIE